VQHVISTALVGFISWNPEIRNVLSVLIGIAVLMGSVILIVSTNTGPRTGMLVGLACLFGWMMVMGLTWTLYGIGLKGKAPHWKVVEISYDLQQAAQPKARQLPELDDQQKVKEILAARPDLVKKVNPEGKDKVISISELVEADPSIEVQFGLAAKDLGGWHILVPPTSSVVTRKRPPMPRSALMARRSSRTRRSTRSSRPSTPGGSRTRTRCRPTRR